MEDPVLFMMRSITGFGLSLAAAILLVGVAAALARAMWISAGRGERTKERK